MTNTKAFIKKKFESGLSYSYLAKKIGISREALYKKRDNVTEFKASEIAILTKEMKLSKEERDNIFLSI
ncbi:toxin-antitoxin system, antitoxin component, Xre family protein [Anaerofustis butyriciformans]|uniref:toxin-antitoxin system, antitoxin component, Xre family protein n=1 Tax=Anaerofustis butyriciformans TaxID=3108533 RepID=UPI002E3245FC|nr:toxin-antitoxin system, antitoxin component, Xre family protein [Anaerofustis sp. HA2171]